MDSAGGRHEGDSRRTPRATRPSSSMTRRRLMGNAGAGVMGLGLGPVLATGSAHAADVPAANATSAPAQAPAAARPPAAGVASAPNRFPRMVQEYFVRRVREVEAEADRVREALKTGEDAGRYVALVREKVRQCFGPFPEKTPLNARVTGVVERDAYRIEKVVFESRPGFLVTANLYVPTGRTFPLPGVVGS